MEIYRYPQPPMGWNNSSPYVKRILAVFVKLPTVKQRLHQISRKELLTAASWEARGLPLDIALYGMVQTILGRLTRAPALPRLGSIGSLRYFEAPIENYKAQAERIPLTWAQLLEHSWAQLQRVYPVWVDPGVNWPPSRDPVTGRTAPEEKRYQKKIEARARKWGLTCGEAEARMIERARSRGPRQKRLKLPRIPRGRGRLPRKLQDQRKAERGRLKA